MKHILLIHERTSYVSLVRYSVTWPLHIEFRDCNRFFYDFHTLVPAQFFTDGMGHFKSICPVDTCYALEMYKPETDDRNYF